MASQRATRTPSEQQAAQEEIAALIGPDWADGLVFTNDIGSHIHATHLLAAGVNAKIVADRLGHHSVAFTLDTYTHVMPGRPEFSSCRVYVTTV